MFMPLEPEVMAILSYVATKLPNKKISGAHRNSEYSIFKKDDDKLEFFVKSKVIHFHYRVFIIVKENGLSINTSGSYYNGVFSTIYPELSKNNFSALADYALEVLTLEAQKYISITDHKSGKKNPGIERVSEANVSSYQRKNGIHVRGYYRAPHFRKIN